MIESYPQIEVGLNGTPGQVNSFWPIWWNRNAPSGKCWEMVAQHDVAFTTFQWEEGDLCDQQKTENFCRKIDFMANVQEKQAQNFSSGRDS